jgi:sporulation protein YlmC with PRC-barrel domain
MSEAHDAAMVEKVVKELRVPYDKVVAVKQVLP